MSFAVSSILVAKDKCCESFQPKVDEPTGKLNTGSKMMIVYMAVDALVAISSLVIGLLGIFSIFTLPAAASYALIGVTGVVVAAYIVMAIVTKGEGFTLGKDMIAAAFCSKAQKGNKGAGPNLEGNAQQ